MSNTGRHVLIAAVIGGKSDRDTAIRFLRLLVEREKQGVPADGG